MQTVDDIGRPARAVAAAGGVSGRLMGGVLTLVTTVEGLWRLEPGWRKLERDGSGVHGVFQSFDWVMAWARAYAGAGSGCEPHIIAGYRGDELKFLWPLMLERKNGIRVLRWLSEPLAQYGDILLGPREDADAWGHEAVSLLRRLRHIDTVRLRHVRADAICRPFIARLFRDARHADQAPWLDLTAFAGLSDYEARYTPTQRKRRKKIRKSLEAKFGPVSFAVLPPGACRDMAIAAAIAEKCRWLDERGRHNWVLCQKQLTGFLRDVGHGGGGSLQLVVSEMRAGGTVLSWQIGLRFRSRHFAFVTAHVNAMTDYSPARLHMDFSQRQALLDGDAAFDLMVPNDAYKESWSSGSVETRDYHLPLTLRGWAFGRLYLELARPFMRAAYYRLPPAILRPLKRVAGS